MIETVLITQHLTFRCYASNRYYVYSTHDNTLLGDIYYFPKWHRYVFEPTYDKIFASSYLTTISEFLVSLIKIKE